MVLPDRSHVTSRALRKSPMKHVGERFIKLALTITLSCL